MTTKQRARQGATPECSECGRQDNHHCFKGWVVMKARPNLLEAAKEALNVLADLEDHPRWSDKIEGEVTRNLLSAVTAAEGKP